MEQPVSVDKTFSHMAVVSSVSSPRKSMKFVPWAVAIPVFKVMAKSKVLVSE